MKNLKQIYLEAKEAEEAKENKGKILKKIMAAVAVGGVLLIAGHKIGAVQALKDFKKGVMEGLRSDEIRVYPEFSD